MATKTIEPPKALTHAERRARRKEIADYVRSGKTRYETMAKFQCSLGLVVESCREHGVPHTRTSSAVEPSTYSIIARILKGVPPRTIAEDAKISVARVEQIRDNCRKAGIPVPSPRPNGPQQKKGRVKV